MPAHIIFIRCVSMQNVSTNESVDVENLVWHKINQVGVKYLKNG